MPLSHFYKNTLTLLSALLVAACTSNTKFNYDVKYDFANISNYSIYPRGSKFNDIQHLSDYQRNRFEIAIEQAMEQRNYPYQNYLQADIVVSYFLVKQSLQELKVYNKAVKACIACGEAEQQQLNKDIKSSMLIIDIVDNKKKRSVYRSFAKLKLSAENNSEENQDLIDQAIENILINFPAS